MPIINLETFIDAPIGICFDLSRSIDLHVISTGQTGEKAIAGRLSGLIELNETVTWSAVHFGIRQQLQSKITSFNYPVFFCDEMQKGAFSKIRHEHHFTERANRTLMTDIFDFDSPLGILGRTANILFLTSYMKALLEKRNKVIKDYAENGSWKKVLPPQGFK